MTNQSVKREPVGNSSKVSKAERLNTWLPEIAAALLPGSPAKAQPDGGVRISTSMVTGEQNQTAGSREFGHVR
jgi:hypothetical protein